MSPIPKPPKAKTPIQKAIEMSPIPKPPKAKTPIQKAIENILAQGMKPPMLIVHPSDAADLKTMMQNAPIFVGPPSRVEVSGGPLMKAYNESLKRAVVGRSVSGVSWDEQHSMDKTELEQQLEDSLWARATLHTSIFTLEQLYASHVGRGHMEDGWYLKRVNGGGEVFLLCKCEVILVMARCRYGAEVMQQCEEPAYPKEATLKADDRCSTHQGTQRGPT